MTEYERLCRTEELFATIEIREKETGKIGIASINKGNVELFYGADDGSDDKVISPEQFNRDFEITGASKD